jgi:hypothetical protein
MFSMNMLHDRPCDCGLLSPQTQLEDPSTSLSMPTSLHNNQCIFRVQPPLHMAESKNCISQFQWNMTFASEFFIFVFNSIQKQLQHFISNLFHAKLLVGVEWGRLCDASSMMSPSAVLHSHLSVV